MTSPEDVKLNQYCYEKLESCRCINDFILLVWHFCSSDRVNKFVSFRTQHFSCKAIFWWWLITDCLVCAVPSPPWNVTAVQLNAHQVVVRWQAPKAPNGTILSYVIFQTPPIPPIRKLQTGSKTSLIVNGDYDANVNYSFWVSDFPFKVRVHVMLHLTLTAIVFSSCMLCYRS